MQNLNEIFRFWPTISVESIILGPCCEADLQSTDWNSESPFCRKRFPELFGENLEETRYWNFPWDKQKQKNWNFFCLPELEQLVLLSFGCFLLFFQDPVCRLDRAEPCCQVGAKWIGKVCFKFTTIHLGKLNSGLWTIQTQTLVWPVR